MGIQVDKSMVLGSSFTGLPLFHVMPASHVLPAFHPASMWYNIFQLPPRMGIQTALKPLGVRFKMLPTPPLSLPLLTPMRFTRCKDYASPCSQFRKARSRASVLPIKEDSFSPSSLASSSLLGESSPTKGCREAPMKGERSVWLINHSQIVIQ